MHYDIYFNIKTSIQSKMILITSIFVTSSEEFPEEQLKAKKSELRLYCDLLMQQVHSVKQAVSSKDDQPDIWVSTGALGQTGRDQQG